MKLFIGWLIVFMIGASNGMGMSPGADSTGKDTTKYTSFKDLPLKPQRKVAFTTTEGTWTSLDVSPDGKTIVFDMMGDLYTMPITGGKATQLTRGIAFDSHPRWSPDGRKILFSSDRSGAENIWWIDPEKKDTFQVTKERDQNFPSAAYNGRLYEGSTCNEVYPGKRALDRNEWNFERPANTTGIAD
ncbi:MAG TPA: hypothetical protein VGQ51_17795 [Puia sp.]|jgi:Tol biopolymer transport system component|nr:hypothetical protein [Puia sp.]